MRAEELKLSAEQRELYGKEKLYEIWLRVQRAPEGLGLDGFGASVLPPKKA